MQLAQTFDDALGDVEASKQFLPFVGGEAARIERCAIACKRCFDVGDREAVDPRAVAGRIGVPVVETREQFATLGPDLCEAILDSGSTHWSAGTMVGPAGPLIVLNPMHAETRKRVTLAEEIAHLVMGHPPSQIDPVLGMRTYSGSVEQEAFGVGGALVVPYCELFDVVKAGASTQVVADTFGVSSQLATCRINRAGLRKMHNKRKFDAGVPGGVVG